MPQNCLQYSARPPPKTPKPQPRHPLPPTCSRSPEQREQLDALLEDIYGHWVTSVAAARGKTREDVEVLLNEGVYDMNRLLEGASGVGQHCQWRVR